MVRADALGSCKEAARYPGQSRELTREYERDDFDKQSDRFCRRIAR